MHPFEFTANELSAWTPLTQAIAELIDCHFKLFNEQQRMKYNSRAWKAADKGLAALMDAVKYLRTQYGR